jgi:predicted nucleic acid-binding protein
LTQALQGWITEVTPDPSQVQQFSGVLRSAADCEVWAVAREKAVDHVLSSDRGLYREATRVGLSCLSTTEVVLLLKRQGLIANVKPVLDRMRQRRFGIDTVVYEATLRAAGEWPNP